MRPNKFILDFNENKLFYRDKSVEIKTHTVSLPQLVCASSRIQIEPHRTTVYEHKINSRFSKNYILNEKASKVEIEECVTSIREDKIRITLTNRSNIKKTLNQHALLCKISDCEITSTINNESELKEFIRDQSEVS